MRACPYCGEYQIEITSLGDSNRQFMWACDCRGLRPIASGRTPLSETEVEAAKSGLLDLVRDLRG